MIHQEMYGSGPAKNLLINIMVKKNNVLQVQAALFCVAARGTTNRGTCARLAAAGSCRLTAAGAAGSGWPGS